MRWDVRPYEGFGPRSFGMAPSEVASIEGMGEPTRSNTVFDGSLVVPRHHAPNSPSPRSSISCRAFLIA